LPEKHFPQRFAASAEARFDRAHGNGQRLGHFILSEALYVGQKDDLPEWLRYLAQGLAQLPALLLLEQLRFRASLRSDEDFGHRFDRPESRIAVPSGTAAALVQKHIAHNRVQPRAERGAEAVGTERAKHFHQGFLRQVLGAFGVTAAGEREGVDLALVLRDEQL